MTYRVYEENLDDARDEAIAALSATREHATDARRYDWLYRDNPDGEAVLWAIRKQATGEMAGFTVVLPRRVLVDGQIVSGPSRERGMVFQQDAILLWRKVLGNVEYGLELRGVDKKERREIAMEYIRLVGLERFAHFFPKELSGGMRKRVQIAAIFANSPEVLLMDEPFGSLDYPTKISLQEEVLKIWARDKKTTLFVTHDVEEALFLADRIFVLRSGQLERIVRVPFPRPRQTSIRAVPEFRDLLVELWDYLADRPVGDSG